MRHLCHLSDFMNKNTYSLRHCCATVAPLSGKRDPKRAQHQHHGELPKPKPGNFASGIFNRSYPMTYDPTTRPRPKPRNPDRARPKPRDPDPCPSLTLKQGTAPAPAKEWQFEQAMASALAAAIRWIEYIPERAAWRWTPKGPEISPRRFAIFVCEFLGDYDCPINLGIVDDCEQRLVSMWLADRH